MQFVSSSGKESSPFLFTRHDPRECGRTWHVERAKFDQFLLDNAAKKGVEVHRGARVLEVVFEGDRAIGVAPRRRARFSERDARRQSSAPKSSSTPPARPACSAPASASASRIPNSARPPSGATSAARAAT